MGDARLKSAFNLIAIDTAFCGRTEAAHREKHEIEVSSGMVGGGGEGPFEYLPFGPEPQDSAICLVSVLDQLELPAYSIVGKCVSSPFWFSGG